MIHRKAGSVSYLLVTRVSDVVKETEQVVI